MKYLYGILVLVLFSCGPDIEALNKKASQFEGQQNYSEALKIRNQILVEHPNDLYALYNRGVCHQALGSFKLAELDYVKVLALDSMHLEANFNLGALYQSVKEWNASILCFSRIIGDGEAVFNLKPEEEGEDFNIYNEAVYQRGNTYLMKKDWSAAELDFQKCVSMKYKTKKSKELLEFCSNNNQVY